MDPGIDPAHREGVRRTVSPAHHGIHDLTRNVTRFLHGRCDRGRCSLPVLRRRRATRDRTVELADRGEVYLALRTVLHGSSRRPADLRRGVRHVLGAHRPAWTSEMAGPENQPGQMPDHGQVRHTEGAEKTVQLSDMEGESPEDSDDEDTLPLYSPVEILSSKDFSKFRADEMRDIARAIVIIAHKLATRESRRTRAAQRSHIIDARDEPCGRT